jgi:radical SAM superfamily enzyme YgiQ (UPF0313 family)
VLANIYEGSIFRPPSEARSLILQATIGCSWNRCTFCTAFREKEFRIKSFDEVERDVGIIHRYYRDARRIFLADGNALAMPTDKLERIIEFLSSRFDRLERVSIYGGPLDIMKKSASELRRLRRAGLDIVYFGLESGSDEVLRRVRKGATSRMMIDTARKVRDAGLKLSTIFILGLGGTELTEDHARETARVVSAQDPEYAAALTLMVRPDSEIITDVREGDLTLLEPDQALDELKRIVEGIDVTDCVFRVNHASNYAITGGTLPGDKENILRQIDAALASGAYKPEFFRRL